MFFILLYLQKENINPRNYYTLKIGKKCFSKNKSVLSSNNYGPGENLSEVTSKKFIVLKWNQALLKGWPNCAFWTPYNFATTISHARVMAAGCPDARDAGQPQIPPGKWQTAGPPRVPNACPGHFYPLTPQSHLLLWQKPDRWSGICLDIQE